MDTQVRARWFGRLGTIGVPGREGGAGGSVTTALRRTAPPINAITGVIVALAPFISQRPADERPLYAVVGLVFALSAVTVLLTPRARPVVTDSVAIAVPTVATLVLVAMTAQVGVLPMLLVWSALATPYFSTRFAVALNLAVIALGMTVALQVSQDPRFSALAWTVTMLMCTLCSLTVRGIAERVDALLTGMDERARRDSLTGLLNRRAFDDALDAAWVRPGPLSVVFLDLDHFKAVNDRYGHAGGDEVLRAFAQVLSDHVRVGDVVARTGGEEFGIVLQPCSGQAALRRARVVVEAFAAHDVTLGGEQVQCTASAGAASREERHRSASDLARAADRALYAAKDAGRNRALLEGVPGGGPVPVRG